MKKGLLAVLMAAALVVPAFAAEKGSMEIDGKLGLLFSPTMKVEASGMSGDIDYNTTFSLGADFFYYVEKEIAVGAGLEYVVSSKIDKLNGESVPSGFDSHCGTTNLFFQAKYDFIIENDIFNNIYPIVQLGYGIVSVSSDLSDVVDVKNGLYWGIGVGTTMKENFIVELMYALNYGTIEPKEGPITVDATLKVFKLKVGYKFAI